MGLFRHSIAIITAIILSLPGIARADCVDPAAQAGRIVFSSSDAGMQYCNGADWIKFPKRSVTASCGNLDSWAAQSVAASGWDAVAYGAGRFVAVSQGSGAAMTSVDGITWDPIPTVFGTDVAYGDGLFVVVTADHWQRRTFTSSDGVNWNTHDNSLPAGGGRWHKVTYGNGYFVVVSWSGGGANKSIRSTDGINWTVHAIGDRTWWDVTYANGVFVAMNHHGPDVAVSSDGENWTQYAGVVSDINHLTSIGYGNGLFVVVARDGANRVMTSPDGVSWTVRTATEANSWESVTFGNGMFAAVAATGTNRVMVSLDGINWSHMASAEANEWRGVAYGDGRFVAVANTGTNRVMTTDCTSPGCENPEGPAGRIMYNADFRVAQWCDGATWNAMGPLNPTGPNDGCENPVKPAGNLLFNADYCILQYCDGDTWQGIGELNPCACKSETADLVGHWPLDEGSGLTASDASGNGNHGTLVSGPTWVVGHIGGGALSFDATNDRVVIANESNFDFDRTNAFTISTWLRQTGPTSHGIVGKWIGTPGYGIYGGLNGDWFDSQQCSGNCIIFGMQNASSQYMEVMVNNAVTLNTWTHVVATYDGSSARSGMRVYLNGVPATTVPIGQATLGGSILNNDAFRIGAFANSSVYYGRLDDARVYNRALTPAEVSSLYSNNSLCP